MKTICLGTLLLVSIITIFCNNSQQKQQGQSKNQTMYKEGSFGYDLNFLSKHDSVVVLKSDEQSQIIVSPKYQGKVFTSTANGNDGMSFGWVNYKAFSGTADEHMNAYGGENRLWLGPEGGKFSLFFKPGSEMIFDNWKTPGAFDTESWSLIQKSDDEVRLQKEMELTNYKGTQLKLSIDRNVKLLGRQQIYRQTKVDLDGSVKVVGYQTMNILTNKGTREWTEATGVPCMWLLDMFKPSPETVIVIPFKKAAGQPFEKVATTDYFGQILPDRIKHTDEVLYFKADGKSRGKLGVVAGKAKPLAGSYDAKNKILTLIMFDVASNARYLNQEWNTTRPSFAGDAVNAYNDGPLKNGTQMGPFYEIESVSPAAFLKPGQSVSHKHSVFHFTGSEDALNKIALKLFGINIHDIEKAF